MSMFTRRLHRDPRIHAMFAAWAEKWNIRRNDPAFISARRLFRTWDEMQAFFQLAYPGSIPIGDHRYIVDIELFGNVTIDAILVLSTLEQAEVAKNELTPAAFLVADNDNCAVYGDRLISDATSLLGAKDLQQARQFIMLFEDTPLEDLRTVFAAVPWANTGVAPWTKKCLVQGVPAVYVEQLLASPMGRFHLDEWTPEKVRDLYEQGAPAGYLALYWKQPDKFDELWKLGISHEYAQTLEEAGV